MSGSKSRSSQTSRSDNTSVSIGIGGDNNGFLVNGSGNHFTSVDHGAVEGAIGIVNDALVTNESISLGAINGVLTANDGANALSELAIMEAGENADTFMSLAGDVVESNANLANNFGDNLAYLTDSTLSNNNALTEKVLDNNNYLIEGFGAALERSSERESQNMQFAINNNTALASQFASDLKDTTDFFGSNIADLTSQSLSQNAQLTSEYGSNLADLTSQTQTALTDMAVLQEAGLDNALQIAGSLGTEDNSEASTNMVKYVMMGVGALAVAMVIKK
ncbi:hypothetical protein [Thalassotalea hakodatensis]|uniref:hypothetical protein n=1 Tax=Thalassotalea hakodatensis TaxID=3030492 RepID=UPI002572D0A5|nr:hypothetical protein [Thalassotalea hakodatensis]